MAVMRNSIIFGGVDSADFGIYIGGEGTFNAPKRDVEMISIPGRNGAFALDKGRFKNIEVTYSAFNFEPDLDTFSAQLEAFRNAICSQKGYQRLTDTFHPDEYRMAAYIDGLEIKPVNFNTASTFDIVFDCKPQRFLTSGEEPITIGEWHETETASGEIASFEAKDGDAVKSLVVDIEPTQSGSGTPSPTNIRPISGYDSVVVSRTQTNIWDEEWEVGKLDGNGLPTSGSNIRSKNYIPILPTRYFWECSAGNGVCLYDNNKAYITTLYYGANEVMNLTPYQNARYMKFFAGTAYGTTYNHDVSINYPSTDHEYHAYNGNTYTTDLNTTRYGGTLDVVSGVLTDKMGMVDLGTLSWSYNSSNGFFYANVVGGVTNLGVYVMPNILCSIYKTDVSKFGSDFPSAENGIVTWSRDSSQVQIKNTAYTDATSFKTAMDGVQLCYELATPQTVQLTAQEVELLVGLNQVWANSGDVSVEYGTAPNVLINPTLFESSPMLEVEGYGSININDDTVAIASDTIGWTIVAPKKTLDATSGSCTFPFDDSLANSGDDIRFNGGDRFSNITLEAKFNVLGIVAGIVPHTDPTGLEGGWSYSSSSTNTWLVLRASFPYASFDYGTQKTIGGTITFTPNFTDSTSKTIPLSVSLVYGGGNEFTLNWSTTLPSGVTFISASVTSWQIELNSSKSALGFPLYIDLDIGEAYKIEDGAVVSINNAVTIPAELPKLKSGANEITYDNTIADLKVVPRWWRI